MITNRVTYRLEGLEEYLNIDEEILDCLLVDPDVSKEAQLSQEMIDALLKGWYEYQIILRIDYKRDQYEKSE